MPPKVSGPPRSEVDDLISKTLSGLDLGADAGRRKRPAPVPERPPRRPAPPEEQPFDLSDLEEMIRSHKGGARRSAARTAAVPSPPEGPSGARPEVVPPSAATSAEPPLEPTGGEPAKEAPSVPAEEPAASAAAAEASKPPRKDSAPGVEFGQYRLLERIGVGGMAEVWKARMTGVEGFQKTVAIKKILPHLTDSPAFVDMFIDEAKLAAQLSHSNIIHIYDLGKIGDDYYIAMEYVEGENLRNILNAARERGKPLPVGLALHVAARLASALEHAHRTRDFEDRDLGLVHRDVSPQNVLIGYEGTIKLCDFGIVKAVSKSSHTQMGALKGKLQYMSPEQAWGRKVDGRSDIFALGTLLFEMLTGQRLFVGESELEVLEAVRECRVDKPSELRPEVGEEVDAVVLEALAREPADRFQSAGDLAKRLEGILAAMRPAPGQAELAAYMDELFGRSHGAAGSTAPDRVPPAEVPLAERSGAESPGRLPMGAVAEPADPGAGSVGAAAGTASGESPAVQAVEPVSPVEPEEGGGRGKGLLVAAILVALVAGAVLVWYLLRPGSGSGAAPELEVPAQAEAPRAPGAAESAQAGTAGETPGTAPAAAAAPAAGSPGEQAQAGAAGAAAPATADPEVAAAIDRALKAKMAEREKELRSQFEAEERRLKDQLDEIQKEKEPEPPKVEAEKAPAKPPAPAPAPASAQPAAPPEGTAAPAADVPPPQPAPEASADEADAAPATPAPAKPAPRELGVAGPGTRQPAPEPAPPPAPREPAVREGELVSDGPGVVRPQVVTLAKPEYPPMARRLRVQGEVVVSVLVDEAGRVVDTRVEKRVPQEVGLNEAALEAARNARFRPATKNGVRVKMWTTISFPFKL